LPSKSRKGKRAAELIIAQGTLSKYRKERAAELVIADKEPASQNQEKKIELLSYLLQHRAGYQNQEKEKERQIIANKELLFKIKKRKIEPLN
jgi:transposase